MAFEKFNITYVKDSSSKKRIKVNNKYLYANFNLIKEDKGQASQASVEYDLKEKLILIHTNPAKEDIKFPLSWNGTMIRNCLLSTVMPAGTYLLVKEQNGDFIFKLNKVRVFKKRGS